MSHTCSGKRDCGTYCRLKVSKAGDYCRFHHDQKPQVVLCKCHLDSGSTCSYPAGPNGFCEYHVQPAQCQGKILMGGLCLRPIPGGKFCSRCKHQADVVTDSVKVSADNMRSMLTKEHGPIILDRKPTVVPFSPFGMFPLELDVKIPEGLKKVELAKPEDCCICLDAMVVEQRNTYRQLTCGHWFHLDCISKIMDMTCPMCRAPVSETSIPKWVSERIKENVIQKQKDDDEAHLRAAQQIGRRVIQEQLVERIRDHLEIDSSEEEDLNAHLQNGARMHITQVVDQHGQPRFALVVTSSSQ